MVGATVLVCLRSCLVGFSVATGTFCLEMGNLSFCFRLLSLSAGTKTVSGAKTSGPGRRRCSHLVLLVSPPCLVSC